MSVKPLDAIRPQAADSRQHFRFVSLFQGARYEKDATQTIATATTAIIDYANVVFDPYAAVTIGANWRYTVARNRQGVYRVSASVHLDAAAWTINAAARLDVYLSGVAYDTLDYFIGQAASTQRVHLHGTTLVKCLNASYIDIRLTNGRGGNVVVNATGLYSNVEICLTDHL